MSWRRWPRHSVPRRCQSSCRLSTWQWRLRSSPSVSSTWPSLTRSMTSGSEPGSSGQSCSLRVSHERYPSMLRRYFWHPKPGQLTTKANLAWLDRRSRTWDFWKFYKEALHVQDQKELLFSSAACNEAKWFWSIFRFRIFINFVFRQTLTQRRW